MSEMLKVQAADVSAAVFYELAAMSADVGSYQLIENGKDLPS